MRSNLVLAAGFSLLLVGAAGAADVAEVRRADAMFAPVPVTLATRPASVLPAKLTSAGVKPVTGALKTTEKTIGDVLVGSL